MGLTDLIFGPKTKAQVGTVQFDCSVSETHSKEAQITDHPVEEGSTISDHIRRQPESLELNGIVTNHPIIFLASIQAPSPLENDLSPTPDRAEVAYATLREIMDKGELVTVVTSFWEYENMAITSMSVTRDAQNGNVLNCNLGLREIIIAKTETVAAPEPSKAAQKKAKDAGKKAKGAASAAQSGGSQSILSSLGGLFGA
jgi:hypothetical protein